MLPRHDLPVGKTDKEPEEPGHDVYASSFGNHSGVAPREKHWLHGGSSTRSLRKYTAARSRHITVGDLVGGRSEHTASIPVLAMDPNAGKDSWSRKLVAVGPYRILESPA